MPSTTRSLTIPLILVTMILASCAKGPIGSDARLGKPNSLTETRRALADNHPPGSPHCLRNTTTHSIQFEMLATAEDEWQRWILPPGQVMLLDRQLDPEIRFVSVSVATGTTMPGNEARLVHYRLDPDPPLREVMPIRDCLHEFRPRPNGMLDLFLNSDLAT